MQFNYIIQHCFTVAQVNEYKNVTMNVFLCIVGDPYVTGPYLEKPHYWSYSCSKAFLIPIGLQGNFFFTLIGSGCN